MINFIGDKVIPKGIVKLTIIVGTYPTQVSKEIDFLVVDCPLTYNVILTTHSIGEIKRDQVLARECYQATLASGENQLWMIDKLEPVLEPSEVPQDIKVVLRDLTKVLKIGSALSTPEKTKITNFLRENKDIFVWKHEDMP